MGKYKSWFDLTLSQPNYLYWFEKYFEAEYLLFGIIVVLIVQSEFGLLFDISLVFGA